MKHEAIYNLYSSVKKINETDNGVLTAYDANDNVVSINMSDVNAKAEELIQEELAKEQAKIDAKASALAKLEALGLTQEEVKAIL
ncbi:hypothetical protein P025_gp42 [Pelagibacter phage HTVC025P]|jgi:hypothetical protein|uniref:Uncharacterized protein n=1 Tax=Pelagibacter phage HTVC025P TaxID=2259657 RepID=A0A4Y1NUY7_9CAUD|nr:hypothetical protein P025_gp42 [Pelagibacter phage HTVC025P]